MQNDFLKKMQDRDKRLKERVPKADPAVLAFITELACCAATDGDQYEVIRSTFRAGYCWHFAMILKNVFERGEVCWAAPFGHIVWVDENGIPYDIEGLNDGEQIYNIPVSYLGDFVRNFIHRPGEIFPGITKDQMIDIIRRYEADNNLPHEDLKPWIGDD